MENNISPRVDEIENEVVNISLSGYNKYFTLGISYGSPVLGDHNTGILVLSQYWYTSIVHNTLVLAVDIFFD